MAIKAIFFDAAGTLIQPIRRVGESYSLLARPYGVKIPPSEISTRFHSCFNSAPPLAFPDTPLSAMAERERSWWKQLVCNVFEPWGLFDGFDDYFAELFSYFSQPNAWELYPEVLETLVSLKKRGLTLAVVSNFDSRLIGILEGLGAGQYLEHIFVSSRMGCAKPAREIFQAACAAHAVAAKDVIHVGDSEEKDFCGAIGAGLNAILIDRNALVSKKAADTICTLDGILPRVDEV